MPKHIVPTPELKQALDLVLGQVKRIATRKNANEYLKFYSGTHYDCGWKFIHVIAATVEFMVLPNGDAYRCVFRRGYHQPDRVRPMGNIIRFVALTDWRRRVCFLNNSFGYPSRLEFVGAPSGTGEPVRPVACGVCTRTKSVKETVLGPRCCYCRGSDVRHMTAVRDLGVTPRVGRRPIFTNESYYRPT